MSYYQTHVCLVSAQAAPNLLPLLDEAFKPKKVVLLVTPQMVDQGQWLCDVIKPRGIHVDTLNIDSASDFNAIQEVLMNLLENEDSDSIALNATGGTKWMAIAAQEIFRLNESAVFYVDVETDRLLFLQSNTPPHPLTQRIDIDSYLKSYGYHIVSQQQTGLQEQRRDLCEQLILHVVEWEGAIGLLNRLANQAQKDAVLKVNSTQGKALPIYFDKLIGAFYTAGIILHDNVEMIEFANHEAVVFSNGGWLELYVNRMLGELRRDGVLQDSPRLNVCFQKGGNKNEIDVAFMAKNRLHIIECKTRGFHADQAGQAGTEAVYKLDSISELGGLGTRSMIVSYRKLRRVDKQRAKDLKIKVIEGVEIQQLKTKLRDWI